MGLVAQVRTNVALLGMALTLNALIGLLAVGCMVSEQTLFQRTIAAAYRGRVFGSLGAVRALMMLLGVGRSVA